MVEIKAFLAKPNHQNCVPLREECVYNVHSLKERRLLRESKFVQFKVQNSIPRKMVERKAFLAKSKH